MSGTGAKVFRSVELAAERLKKNSFSCHQKRAGGKAPVRSKASWRFKGSIACGNGPTEGELQNILISSVHGGYSAIG